MNLMKLLHFSLLTLVFLLGLSAAVYAAQGGMDMPGHDMSSMGSGEMSGHDMSNMGSGEMSGHDMSGMDSKEPSAQKSSGHDMPEMSDQEMQGHESGGEEAAGVNWYVVGSFLGVNSLIILAAALLKPKKISLGTVR